VNRTTGNGQGARPALDESYEALVEQLEDIVRRLEEDGLSLDEAVGAYETGMRLVQRCNDLLDRAELRISELSEQHRNEPLDEDVDQGDQPRYRGMSLFDDPDD
jgi:exodeoxyribonuclease VII small subunit